MQLIQIPTLGAGQDYRWATLWTPATMFSVSLNQNRPVSGSMRVVGRPKNDVWDRFAALQRNLRPFLRGKPKRARVERFRTYAEMEDA